MAPKKSKTDMHVHFFYWKMQKSMKTMKNEAYRTATTSKSVNNCLLWPNARCVYSYDDSVNL